ncbi:MAG: Chemotaxis protein CheY [Syntrophorhabdaceae bacterium PtaU1.Bin034]|jgi:DNA-binding response OmpR family regulator|nr:MAG: Chemotaxis protein CheY [Syntrophorhabdaceae bacterium PtaU1.Bin034]
MKSVCHEKGRDITSLPKASRGSETILIAEPDSDVRRCTKEILRRRGYRAVEAMDGKEAIRIFADNKDRIDLVILDVIMPKKTGKEVYNEIIKIRPGMRVIFSSGCGPDIMRDKGIQAGTARFLTKPLSSKELLQKVRDVLDE